MYFRSLVELLIQLQRVL